jgi:hypothetical protein
MFFDADPQFFSEKLQFAIKLIRFHPVTLMRAANCLQRVPQDGPLLV